MVRVPHQTPIEPFKLRVRGEEIGIAVGIENVCRAEQFLCDRLSRSVRTPWWALSSDPDVPLSNLTKGYTQPDAED